jgi:hypothetical protein
MTIPGINGESTGTTGKGRRRTIPKFSDVEFLARFAEREPLAEGDCRRSETEQRDAAAGSGSGRGGGGYGRGRGDGFFVEHDRLLVLCGLPMTGEGHAGVKSEREI